MIVTTALCLVDTAAPDYPWLCHRSGRGDPAGPILLGMAAVVALPQSQNIKGFTAVLGQALPHFTEHWRVDTDTGDDHLTFGEGG